MYSKRFRLLSTCVRKRGTVGGIAVVPDKEKNSGMAVDLRVYTGFTGGCGRVPNKEARVNQN